MTVHPLGQYLKRMRLARGLSLRQVADHLQITHVTYGEVERGVKATFARRHWSRLMEIIPEITEADLERESSVSRPLQLNLMSAPASYQELGRLLARTIEDGQYADEDDVATFLRALRRREEVSE
jgi:transcriptional regulator with XRE-family HTH domain